MNLAENLIWDEIQNRLNFIESQEQVRIVYAVESGSRAWGFPSRDSDYDVRFVYVRRPDWYLSINVESRRDVIERPIEGVFDINGWDIRKALGLLAKSNPPFLEWLQSPIVYRDELGLADSLRTLMPVFYSPTSSVHHYRSMAKGNFREYLRGDVVRLKKYLYVLRPILSALWIKEGRGPAPIEFDRVLTLIDDQPEVLAEVHQLLKRKQDSDELAYGPRLSLLHAFLEKQIEVLEQYEPPKAPTKADQNELNIVFLRVLRQAWPDARLEWS